MKIDCCQLAELLVDFINGELPEDRRGLLEEHLRACPPCLIYVETYRLTITITRKLPPRPIPLQLEKRLLEALKRECGEGEPGASAPGS